MRHQTFYAIFYLGAIFTRTLFSTNADRDIISSISTFPLDHEAEQKEVYFVFLGTTNGKLVRSILTVETEGNVDLRVISESNQFLKQCQSDKTTVKQILFDETLGAD